MRILLLGPIALALLPAPVLAAGESAGALFQAATASFAAGDYKAAEAQFRACLDITGDHPTVDYNLAVTDLRLEQPGRARAYLERALMLQPRDKRAREELARLLSQLGQIPPPPASWLHALWGRLKGTVTSGQAVGLAAALNALAALAIGLYLLTGRRRFGAAGILLALVAVAGWPLAGAKLAERLGPPRAIVVSDTAALRGGPGEDFGEIERLTEGAVVTLLQRPRVRFGPGPSVRAEVTDLGLWCEVRAASGARGYVRRALIELVYPQPAEPPAPPAGDPSV